MHCSRVMQEQLPNDFKHAVARRVKYTTYFIVLPAQPFSFLNSVGSDGR
jgi:hypothetical protein